MKTITTHVHWAKRMCFLIPAVLLVAALALTCCNESPYINAPGDNRFNLDSFPVTVPDTNGIEVRIDSAITICKKLADNQTSAEVYKMSGILKSYVTKETDIPSRYTSLTFWLGDDKDNQIECYNTNNVNNRPFFKWSDVPPLGSKVTVVGTLTKYVNANSGQTVYELNNSFIVRIDQAQQ